MKQRLLLVPTLTELEWAIRPRLEEWAEVASYDGPGIGDEPAIEGDRLQATAERGLAELDRRGWEGCIVVADELGSIAGLLLAARRPQAVRALVLGHPIVRVEFGPPRPTINREVALAHLQLAQSSFRPFVREQMRAWAGLWGRPVEDADALAESYLERVAAGAATSFHRQVLDGAGRYEAEVDRALGVLREVPKLLVHHEGCLLFTTDGFEAAVAAMPDAETAATAQKPSIDPDFPELMRAFAQRHAG